MAFDVHESVVNETDRAPFSWFITVFLVSAYNSEITLSEKCFLDGNECCGSMINLLYDFLVTVKAVPHECVIRTG